MSFYWSDHEPKAVIDLLDKMLSGELRLSQYTMKLPDGGWNVVTMDYLTEISEPPAGWLSALKDGFIKSEWDKTHIHATYSVTDMGRDWLAGKRQEEKGQ